MYSHRQKVILSRIVMNDWNAALKRRADQVGNDDSVLTDMFGVLKVSRVERLPRYFVRLQSTGTASEKSTVEKEKYG